MPKLFLLRHLKSQWNLEKRFTGWSDVPLSKQGLSKDRQISKKIPWSKIDMMYSSPLFRNMDSVSEILEYTKKHPIFIHLDKGKANNWGEHNQINDKSVQVYISENLNERYYGKLQGLDHASVIKKHGKEQVHLWRRGYTNRPPSGESLKDTYQRAVPFFKKHIEKDLKKGNNVLVLASHNSLRALIKYIEKISDQDIPNVEVEYGGLIEYNLNKSGKVKSKTIL